MGADLHDSLNISLRVTDAVAVPLRSFGFGALSGNASVMGRRVACHRDTRFVRFVIWHPKRTKWNSINKEAESMQRVQDHQILDHACQRNPHASTHRFISLISGQRLKHLEINKFVLAQLRPLVPVGHELLHRHCHRLLFKLFLLQCFKWTSLGPPLRNMLYLRNSSPLSL